MATVATGNTPYIIIWYHLPRSHFVHRWLQLPLETLHISSSGTTYLGPILFTNGYSCHWKHSIYHNLVPLTSDPFCSSMATVATGNTPYIYSGTTYLGPILFTDGYSCHWKYSIYILWYHLPWTHFVHRWLQLPLETLHIYTLVPLTLDPFCSPMATVATGNTPYIYSGTTYLGPILFTDGYSCHWKHSIYILWYHLPRTHFVHRWLQLPWETLHIYTLVPLTLDPFCSRMATVATGNTPYTLLKMFKGTPGNFP